MKTGKTYTSTMVVTEELLARTICSGDLEVLATPALIALMENAAMLCVVDELPKDSTTVGGQISCTHLRPTGLGHTIHATAMLKTAEGRKLLFNLEAEDEKGIIGKGTHLRFIVEREKFMKNI